MPHVLDMVIVFTAINGEEIRKQGRAITLNISALGGG